MNIVFLGLGDLYLPAVAAALHLGQLEEESPPGRKKLESLYLFRHGEKGDEGRLYFAGKDSSGNHIYLLCVNRHPDVVARAMQSLAGSYSLPPREIKIVPCLPDNPQLAALSRLLGRLGLRRCRAWLGCKLACNHFRRLAGACRAVRYV